MQHLQAAAHFGVRGSSAFRCWTQQRALGHVTPRRQGCDRKLERIEGHAEIILGDVAITPNLTLDELQARLGELGAHFATGRMSTAVAVPDSSQPLAVEPRFALRLRQLAAVLVQLVGLKIDEGVADLRSQGFAEHLVSAGL